jgi:hypothetical protein
LAPERLFRSKQADPGKRDLETGEWKCRYAELLALDEYDAGYRLVVAN